MSAALAELPQDQLTAIIVWIPMLPGDNETAAAASSQILDRKAVTQFYDGASRTGRAIAASLGAEGHVAWDMYLTYGSDASWLADATPAPRAHAHQLAGSWADQSRYFTRAALRREIARMVQELVDP